MNFRTLPILNAIGCLALTVLVGTQWRKERALDGALAGMSSDLATARAQSGDESKRRAALERDVAVLKEAIEASQQAAEASARTLAASDQTNVRLQADLTAAREQVAAWETAVTARDARIRVLDGDLAAARRRLDEAIARLKAAGAR